MTAHDIDPVVACADRLLARLAALDPDTHRVTTHSALARNRQRAPLLHLDPACARLRTARNTVSRERDARSESFADRLCPACRTQSDPATMNAIAVSQVWSAARRASFARWGSDGNAGIRSTLGALPAPWATDPDVCELDRLLAGPDTGPNRDTLVRFAALYLTRPSEHSFCGGSGTRAVLRNVGDTDDAARQRFTDAVAADGRTPCIDDLPDEPVLDPASYPSFRDWVAAEWSHHRHAAALEVFDDWLTRRDALIAEHDDDPDMTAAIVQRARFATVLREHGIDAGDLHVAFPPTVVHAAGVELVGYPALVGTLLERILAATSGVWHLFDVETTPAERQVALVALNGRTGRNRLFDAIEAARAALNT